MRKYIEHPRFFLDNSNYGLLFYEALGESLVRVRREKKNDPSDEYPKTIRQLGLWYGQLYKKVGRQRRLWKEKNFFKYRECSPEAWFPKYQPELFPKETFEHFHYRFRKARCGLVMCPYCYVRKTVGPVAQRCFQFLNSGRDSGLLLARNHLFLDVKNHDEADAYVRDWTRKFKYRVAATAVDGVIFKTFIPPRLMMAYWCDVSVAVATKLNDEIPSPEHYGCLDWSAMLRPGASRADVNRAVGSAFRYPADLLDANFWDVEPWLQSRRKKKKRVSLLSYGALKKSVVQAMPKKKPNYNPKILEQSINILDLDVRVINALEDESTQPVVKTVKDLLNCKVDQLKALPNVGDKTIKAIFAALARFGIHSPDYEFPEPTKKEIEEQQVRKSIIGL